MAHHHPARKVGLVAGWGSFPIEVAEHLKAHGNEVCIVAIKGHADRKLETIATKLSWQGVLKLGGHFRFFSKMGCSQIALAGKLFKDRILYQGRGWIEHFPDATCCRVLGQNFFTKSRTGCDDSILSAVVAAYESRGMSVLPVNDVAPQLLAEEGCLTRKSPRRSEMLDIRFGWNIARQMGGLDIGQSVTIRDQVVLAVEAIEGTDALIQRSALLCPRGGFSLVKVAKPNQDMRFDVPTIGPQTIRRMAASGGSAIGIEAGRTIIVERQDTLELANRLGVKIFSMPTYASNLAQPEAAPQSNFSTASAPNRSVA